MPAKMVFVRTENAASVAQALETHAAATGAAWGELLAPFLAESEVLPDMALVQLSAPEAPPPEKPPGLALLQPAARTRHVAPS